VSFVAKEPAGYVRDLQRTWNEFGQKDPLWAILANSSKEGNKWGVDEFFHTGVKEIDALMAHLEDLQIPICKKRALDFGCGVGRLTQALANYFDFVEGVDIAPAMIERANNLNRYGDRCKYHVNSSVDLSLFEDEMFDFVYTTLVLQHVRPDYSKRYIEEFLRVLAPDGVLVFRIMTTPKTFFGQLYFGICYPLRTMYERAYSVIKGPIMEIHFIKQSDLEQLLEASGAKTIDLTDKTQNKRWHRYRQMSQYCVAKV
jgi:ubiquinone/menaquinone biosynthesis C-methylase UbiE